VPFVPNAAREEHTAFDSMSRIASGSFIDPPTAIPDFGSHLSAVLAEHSRRRSADGHCRISEIRPKSHAPTDLGNRW
jgi:hypothetical protein